MEMVASMAAPTLVHTHALAPSVCQPYWGREWEKQKCPRDWQPGHCSLAEVDCSLTLHQWCIGASTLISQSHFGTVEPSWVFTCFGGCLA